MVILVGKPSEIQVYGIILISCEMPELKGHLNEELSIASGPKNRIKSLHIMT